VYLKAIEISGFKSFAKKSSLEFTTPISAIVGPNGSGKSNAAEAFRFVLGEQSIKSMRGKKGEDLIFNGASDGSRSNRASVKVTFDNNRKFLDIDFPEVTIERVVHRDGVNEYFINGTLVRLRDIIELLGTAHIGASGHHIISQGEADRILSSNLKERRTMIEDALGLKIYQYKRQESEKKLEKTLENMKSVEALRKEIAPHIRFLKKQVEKMEKGVELRRELIELSKEYLKKEHIHITSSAASVRASIAPLELKKRNLESELTEARHTLEQSKNKDEKSEKLIELEQSIESARNEKDVAIGNLGKIEGEISSEERIIRKQKEIAATDAGRMVLLSDVEVLSGTVHTTIKEIEESEDVKVIKSLLSKIKQTFTDFLGTKKSESNESVVTDSLVALSVLEKKKTSLVFDLSMLKQKEEELQFQYRELKTNIEKEKDSDRDAEKALFRIMAEQNTVISDLSALTAKLETLHSEEEDFKREREECAMLCGREVLDYEVFVISEISEERHAQQERKRVLQKLKIRLEDSGLGGEGDVMKEFQDASERDTFLAAELEDLEKSGASLRSLIAELGEKIDLEFKEGIQKINTQFQNFFELMFGGGSAKLTVVRPPKKVKKDSDFDIQHEGDGSELIEEDNIEEGIDIEISLPRKKIKGLMMLSGGERALTSIALLFAVSQVKPPPFIILDETDAALDEANSKKYGDMIESLSKYSQLILITHNRETMSRAGVIYGVTMGLGGISKVLSIQFEEAATVAK
jgi:chromosome segregation protein